MTHLREIVRAALVVGRRDFTATVMSKTFLLFLLGPLFPIIFAIGFAGLGKQVTTNNAQPTVAVISSPGDFALLSQQRERLSSLGDDQGLVALKWFAPEPDAARQRDALLASDTSPIVAVLSGGLFAPTLTGPGNGEGRVAKQVGLMVEQAQIEQMGALPGQRMRVATTGQSGGQASLLRSVTAHAGQMLIFFLTILLAGMLLSQLIEEKANKVIEVLASAVPVDAIFLGKLFAMLCTSLVGIFLWGTLGAIALAGISSNGLSALPVPAVGWPTFITLILVYFSMTYLLIGAVFLGIGAHASTAREVQIMSMPVTMAQLLLFGFASLAVGQPDSQIGIAAAVFPLSSPLAMIARAAEVPGLGVHVIALIWQALWVALILRVTSRYFRRSVLKSGGSRRRWWRRTKPNAA
nr:ABC transporter permease [uncultured Sphingomonas sp.]